MQSSIDENKLKAKENNEYVAVEKIDPSIKTSGSNLSEISAVSSKGNLNNLSESSEPPSKGNLNNLSESSKNLNLEMESLTKLVTADIFTNNEAKSESINDEQAEDIIANIGQNKNKYQLNGGIGL